MIQPASYKPIAVHTPRNSVSLRQPERPSAGDHSGTE